MHRFDLTILWSINYKTNHQWNVMSVQTVVFAYFLINAQALLQSLTKFNRENTFFHLRWVIAAPRWRVGPVKWQMHGIPSRQTCGFVYYQCNIDNRLWLHFEIRLQEGGRFPTLLNSEGDISWFSQVWPSTFKLKKRSKRKSDTMNVFLDPYFLYSMSVIQ